MPWFPDFVGAVELARRQTRADGRADPTAAYLTALQRADARDLETTWPGEVVIQDPRAGTVRGPRSIRAFVRHNGEWLAGLHARTETVASTAAGGRAVLELLAYLTQNGREVAWPVAVVAEAGDDRAVEFRTYCSQRPVTGTHHLRPPVLPPSVFSRAAYVPAWLGDGAARTTIIQPAIDPVSAKNLELEPGRVQDVLATAGLLDGRPMTAGGVPHPATLLRDGGPFPRDVPLVVQVSRWDHLKDMAGVLDAFVRGVVDGAPGSGAHLLLAGPSVAGVSDDPEGLRVLEEVTAAWRALPAPARRRVGLASLDMTDVEENALVVNALQRHAAVVTQKSLREGFGLTVAEAMWKSRPVVASAVGGIRDQIDDGVSGRLVDPDDRPAFAAAIVDLLADPGAARRLGAAAHERVREHFLPDRQLREWLDLVQLVRAEAGPADRIAPVSEARR